MNEIITIILTIGAIALLCILIWAATAVIGFIMFRNTMRETDRPPLTVKEIIGRHSHHGKHRAQ